MFKFLMICAIVGLAAAFPGVPVVDEVDGVVLRSEDIRPDGFESKLETVNGINDQRSGDEYGNIKGSFSYISPEGEHVQITYVADENGFQPSGDVLPTPPPIPVEIQKALDWIAAHPSVEH
ncbi:larval cuticle protein 1-like [Drosophila sulfurigaster albostrigata]|uniref:larval cuticle protein 1-like n=1 Tax=Drosophila sulfurigaster albostrigata TaxID=89887 RepID=UPI002D2198ED|nr:larval cuticle protein 1-like [Drosophila sulfurigaster albostrigata]XP_062128200.1 larval cuticle protein 1-like [Drosophila sulfurigaster albostrigata]